MVMAAACEAGASGPSKGLQSSDHRCALRGPVLSNAALSVLYLGASEGTSGHRIATLRRFGHEVTAVDPHAGVPSGRASGYLEWKLLPELLSLLARRHVRQQVLGRRFDVVFVDGGSLVSTRLLKELRQISTYCVLFNHDDPFGPRDQARFRVLRSAVAAYDLFVVVRKPNVEEAWRAGARNIMLTVRTADTVEHAAREISEHEAARWNAEVSFLGTWMPDRGKLVSELIDAGVPVSIYGNSWERSPEWRKIKPFFKGPGLAGEAYAKAIQCSKICIGMLSTENRDLHTTRSLEITRLGSLFCAQRTSEHESLYADGTEAVFWSSAQECAAKCQSLLADENLRKRIALNGQERALRDRHCNDQLFLNIWGALDAICSRRAEGSGDGAFFDHFTA